MPFRIPEPKRFKNGKLDFFVVTVVFIVFLWAFLIDSFRPMLNETGVPITYIDHGVEMVVLHINMQFFLGPIILCYEVLVLVILQGKLKGRELPWGLYYMTFKTCLINKFREGIEEYHIWRKNNKH